jgi:transposase
MARRRGHRKRYSQEFIAQAVQLVNESDRPVVEIARELGVSATGLGKWCKKDEGKEGKAEVIDTPESPEEELKRLRKRVRELEMEKEILKKAAAFFAKESS